MDERLLARERRKQAKLERLGTNKPSCVICGEKDPRCLEAHHIAGRKFDDGTQIVCRNCHQKLSDAQADHPKPRKGDHFAEEIVAHFLLGLADLFEFLIEKFRQFAAQLLANLDYENSKSQVEK